MQLYFESINFDKQVEYLKLLALCPQKASDYSFINVWGWAEEYGLSWAWTDEHVWIKQTKPAEFFWAPVGSWENVSWEKYLGMYSASGKKFVRLPEMLVNSWKNCLKDRLTIGESRGSWDYLYSVDELIKLSGSRFHKKKNLLNQFKKKYAFEFIPLGEEMVNMAMAMQEDWCTWRDCESSELLSAENRAVKRVLMNSEKLLGLAGGAILVDKKMVAYTVAERLPDNTLIIHFEKGSPEYKGAYQAINQMFLMHAGKDYKIVNREQDMDDEGLRKAKQSYHPIDFIKKFNVVLS